MIRVLARRREVLLQSGGIPRVVSSQELYFVGRRIHCAVARGRRRRKLDSRRFAISRGGS